jgi:ribosomal protein L7Ae-like RNA K-turn-binding protein
MSRRVEGRQSRPALRKVVVSREVSEAHTVVSTARSKVAGLLGLARRAGGVTAGTEAAREAVRAGEARLVLMAQDASAAQTAKIRRTLAGNPVPNVSWGTRDELGASVGRAPVSVIAVTHPRLAVELLAVLEPRTSGTVESFSGVEA